MAKLASVLMVLAMACGGGSAPQGGSGATAPATGSGSGEQPTPCEACLASGQNWTAGSCHPSCYMDTYCYGPGNPSAPSCPAPGTEPTEEGEPSW